jgi:RcsF lipoprotein
MPVWAATELGLYVSWEDLVRIETLSLVVFCLSLDGCVSGAPTLTSAQESQVSAVAVYKPGESAPGPYRSLGSISGADCSGAPAGGRVWGNAEKAIDTLKRKAVEIGADAVVNVSCSSIPLLNNCWAAEKCSGEAIKTESKEHN